MNQPNELKVRLRAEMVEWRIVDEQVVALDLDRSVYLGINATGATVWTRLATGATESELLAAILEQFEIDEPTARSDLRAFVDDLRQRGMIEEVASDG